MQRSYRFLVMEREIIIAMDIERILRDTFDCVVEIARPDAMPSEGRECAFDVAIVDADALDEDGFCQSGDVSGLAKSIVLTTAWSDRERKARASFDGPVIRKPFSNGELADAVRGAIARVTGRAG